MVQCVHPRLSEREVLEAASGAGIEPVTGRPQGLEVSQPVTASHAAAIATAVVAEDGLRVTAASDRQHSALDLSICPLIIRSIDEHKIS